MRRERFVFELCGRKMETGWIKYGEGAIEPRISRTIHGIASNVLPGSGQPTGRVATPAWKLLGPREGIISGTLRGRPNSRHACLLDESA